MTKEGFRSASRKFVPTQVGLEKRLVQAGVNPFRAKKFVGQQLEAQKLAKQREKEEKIKISGALKVIKDKKSTPTDIHNAASTMLDSLHFDSIKDLLQAFASSNRNIESRVAALRSTVPLLIKIYKYNESDSRRELNRAGRTFLYVINGSTSSKDLKRLQEEIKLAETQITDAIKAHRDRVFIISKPREVV